LDGLTVRDARTRGIRVITSHHVTVRNCVAANNGIEGINSGFADDLTVENNEAYGNGKGYDGPEGYYEIGKGHGIYLACSGDRPIVRNNRSYENGGCGIQFNGNPREVYEQRGTEPDGSISGAVVENNILYRNGRGGGAAMNLMSVRDSLFVNNLFLHTYSGGICLFADFAGTSWGCRNNHFVNNTIHFKANEGRYGFFFMEGSTDNVLRNNVVSAGIGPALMYTPDSERNDTDYNVLYSASEPERVARTEDRSANFSLKHWQARGRDRNSLQLKPERVFVNASGSRPEDFIVAGDSPAATAGRLFAGGFAEGNAGASAQLGWSPVRPAAGSEGTTMPATSEG
jgi:parallel beta-helix repeat protein